MEIRKVSPHDASAICDIYNYYVENTAITFETENVSVQEMSQRIQNLLNQSFPYYVGVDEGAIVGYCYLHNWHTRSAYITTKEISIYLHHQSKSKKLGSLLYKHLFQEIEDMKIHSIIAGITIPNESSIALHQKFGFKQVSLLKEIGYKFGQWQDVGHWQWLKPK